MYPHDDPLTGGYLTADELLRRARLEGRRARVLARMRQGHRRARSAESQHPERARYRAKATAMLPTLRKAAWVTGTTVDEARVYAGADKSAQRNAVPVALSARRPRRRGAGRPRATASRSGARSGDSGDSDSDGPGEAGPPVRRRVVVDRNYVVIGLGAA